MNAKNSIAVLPFINMSADADNEYFSDGMTEEIINALTKIDALNVTARTSSFTFKNRNLDVAEIGAALKVINIIEGSVRKFGKKVRITAQLVDVTTGFHYWSETYDRQLDDIFGVQDEVAIDIADRVRAQLGHFEVQERLVEDETTNISAYQLYLQGKYYFNQGTPTTFLKAIQYFEQAIAMDTNFSLPYAKAADSYIFMGMFSMIAMEDATQKAKYFIEKALSLPNKKSEAYHASAHLKFWTKWEFKAAAKDLEKAYKLNPNRTDIKGFHSNFLLLNNQIEEGLEAIKACLAIDPYSIPYNYNYLIFNYILGDSNQLLKAVEQTLAINPSFRTAYYFRGFYHLRLKEYEAALNVFEHLPDDGISQLKDQLWKACCYYLLGNTEKAKLLSEQVPIALVEQYPLLYLYEKVVYFIISNQQEQAIQLLARGIEWKVNDLLFFHVDPAFEPLKASPHFQQLIAEHQKIIGLPQLSKPKYKGSRLDDSQLQTINRHLLDYLEHHSAYLDPKIGLRQLAKQINTHANYLSQVINDLHGKNFFEFINTYRIETFKKRLQAPNAEQFTLLSHAFESGFNSKTAFNTTFKKLEGITPSAYWKRLKQE
ncbi:MAG: helix-turn-helix domain-containing protein [Bacteroidota bacterium]